MVPEDDVDEEALLRSFRATNPLILGVGADDCGEHYPPVAPINVVAVEHSGYPGRTLVIDKDGVYLTHGGRCRALYRWADSPDDHDPDILIV